MEAVIAVLVILIFGMMAVAGWSFDKEKNRRQFEREYRKFILGRTFNANRLKTEGKRHEKTANKISAA